jgi:hypothetical protein
MTQTQHHVGQSIDEPANDRGRWPLVGAAAGLFGFLATFIFSVGEVPERIELSHSLFTELSPLSHRLSFISGYVAVALLLVFAAQWRRRVESRVPGSTAAHVVPLGLVTSAAGLTYGYGWKGALGNYMPGGAESGSFDDQGLYVYYVLNDFGTFIGWLGVVVAAGAVAWMALRERTISRWIGVVSLVPVLVVLGLGFAAGVAGSPGLLAPMWLMVTGLGLAFGKSTITR